MDTLYCTELVRLARLPLTNAGAGRGRDGTTNIVISSHLALRYILPSRRCKVKKHAYDTDTLKGI